MIELRETPDSGGALPTPAALDGLGPGALDALALGVVRLDGRGRVAACNPAAARLLGADAAATIGQDFFREVAPATHLPGFHGRFLAGVRRGHLDERFPFVFGLEPQPVQVEVGMWTAEEADRYWIALRPVGALEPGRHRSASLAAEAVGRRARAEPVDPGVCEQEPIHTPQAVQPHVVMLALDPATLVVQACSGNLGDAFPGEAPATAIGRALDALLPAPSTTALAGAIAAGRLADPARPWRATVRLGSVPFALSAHRHDGRLVLELERVPEHPEDFEAATPLQAQDAVAALRRAGTLHEAATTAADEIRAMTGFERVLVYRFDPDWNGEAIAESRVEAWQHSLLGLRFPASDIPAQARALYTRAPGRFVVDRDAVRAPVLAAPETANQAIDLTFAAGRALSPIHLEYQRNLGVNGSMSLSILVEGRLWGLVIGHHRRPHYVTPETRALAGLVADAFALRVHELESVQAWEAQQATLSAQNRLLERLAASDDVTAALTGPGADDASLLDLFAAGGAAVVVDGRIATVGEAPPGGAIQDLAAWLREDLPPGRQVFATAELSEHYAPAAAMRGQASGLLAAFVDGERHHLLLWFRPEVAATVVWGGDPSKPVLADAATRAVLPRRSFERWVEERRGQAEPWAPWQVGTAEAFAAAIGGVVLRQGRRIAALTASEAALRRALEQKDVLAREIDHRVKNSLQIVAGIMLMQARGATDPQARQAFEDTYARVMSVARVHDSLHESEDVEHVDLGETLRRLCDDLSAGMAGTAQRVQVSAGSGLMVASRTAVALSLIATELVTNALKYAYAPGEPGQVEVRVGPGAGGGVELRVCDAGRGLPPDWSERPARGARGGLGMRMIRAMLDQIGGEMRVASCSPSGTCFTVLA